MIHPNNRELWGTIRSLITACEAIQKNTAVRIALQCDADARRTIIEECDRTRDLVKVVSDAVARVEMQIHQGKLHFEDC